MAFYSFHVIYLVFITFTVVVSSFHFPPNPNSFRKSDLRSSPEDVDPIEILKQAEKLRSEAAELEAARPERKTSSLVPGTKSKRMEVKGCKWRLMYSLEGEGLRYNGNGGVVTFKPDGYTDFTGGDMSKVWGWDFEVTDVKLPGGGKEWLLLFSGDLDVGRWGMVPEEGRAAWEQQGGGQGKIYFTGEFVFTEGDGYVFKKGTTTVKIDEGRRKKIGWLTVGIEKGILASFRKCGSFSLEPVDVDV